MKCSKCGSENCQMIEEKKPLETWKIVCAVLFFPIGLLFLFLDRTENVKYCADCGHKEKI